MLADRLNASISRFAEATLGNPAEWLHDALAGGFGFGQSYSGKIATPRNVMGLIPYYSGVQLIAGAVGSLPCIVYTAGAADEDLRARARGTDQWRILHDKPNPEMTADQYFELSQAVILNWGNSFAWKERSNLGTIGELWPIAPERVGVYRDSDGVKRYMIDGGQTGMVTLTDREILHVPGLGHDGLVGYSPVQLARQELGSMLALQEFQGSFWANNTVPLGVLTHPNKVDDAEYKRLKKSWTRSQRGGRNWGKPAILEGGLTWQALGMPLEDAQFIETAKLGDVRCAQLLRIPPHMIAAEVRRSMTYSNTESEGIDFVRWSLRRWLTRHENRINADPVIFPPRLGLMCEFLIDELLRADAHTRNVTNAIMADRGALTINEWRRMENRPPVAWGDQPYKPPVAPADGAARVAYGISTDFDDLDGPDVS